PLLELLHGDQLPAQVHDVVLVIPANVQNEGPIPGIQTALKLDNRDLGYALLLLAIRYRRNSAELLVVDQLRLGWMIAADRAIRILADLERAEAHLERIDHEESSDQRLAHARKHLDHFGGLQRPDESGKH